MHVLKPPPVHPLMPMASEVVHKLRALAETGLPAGAPESFDALAAVYEIGFLCGQQHESRKQQQRFDAIRAEVLWREAK